MAPPVEPMLMFAWVATVVYVLGWWAWWRTLGRDGVELRYSEDQYR